MSTNQVMTNHSSGGQSMLGAIGSSFANVALTAGAGAGVGAVVGKAASMVPLKISEEAMNHQYQDMFIKASNNAQNMPEYTKNMEAGAKGIIEGIIQKGQDLTSKLKEASKEKVEKRIGELQLSSYTDETIKTPEVQEYLKKLFKDADNQVPQGGYLKDKAIERLQKALEVLDQEVKKHGEELKKTSEEFVEKAKGQGFENIQELAKDGAKHLRKTTIMGAAIGIGIIGVLALNLVKSFGDVGRKYMPKQQAAGGNQG